MSMVIDLVTDRWSNELIIKSGNTSPRAIYQDLKHKCAALNLPSTKLNQPMIDKVKSEANYAIIDLFTHVLFYHLAENDRFSTLTLRIYCTHIRETNNTTVIYRIKNDCMGLQFNIQQNLYMFMINKYFGLIQMVHYRTICQSYCLYSSFSLRLLFM